MTYLKKKVPFGVLRSPSFLLKVIPFLPKKHLIIYLLNLSIPVFLTNIFIKISLIFLKKRIKEVFKFLSIELNQNVIVPKPGLKIVGITRTQDDLPQRNGKPLESLLGENDEALSFWENKLKTIKPKYKSKSLPIDFLQIEFALMVKHILRANSLKTFNLSPTVIYLTDLNKCVNFDIKKPELEVFDDISEFDVSMSSECLDQIMKHEFGRGTITINGRFTPNYKSFNKFLDQTNLYYYNNIGRYLGKNLKVSDITNQKNFYTRLLEDT